MRCSTWWPMILAGVLLSCGKPPSVCPPDDPAACGDPVPDAGGGAGDGDASVPDGGELGAPAAQPDGFQTFLDAPIRLAAPGILGNDTSSDLQPLTATLTTNAQHGALTVDADGALTYVPTTGFTGTDTFTYTASDSLGTSPPTTVTLTVKPPVAERTLAILVYHAENTAPRPTTAEVQTRLAQVSTHLRQYSYNALELRGVLDPAAAADVVGWFETPSVNCFDFGSHMALADPFVDLTQYDRVVVVIAQRAGCTLSAMAGLDKQFFATPDGQGHFGLARLSVPNASTAVLAHELGHTLKNNHGSFLDCGAVPWAASGCSTVTYGNPYDFMSIGIGHASARRKSLMGWFNPVSNRIDEVVTSGVYTIEPIETNTGGVKALQIARGGGFPLYLEYRQPLGTDVTFGAGANAFTGLLVYAGASLLDMTPPAGSYGPTPPTDAQLTPALPVGSSWVDPATGNTVAVLDRTASAITVQITIVP